MDTSSWTSMRMASRKAKQQVEYAGKMVLVRTYVFGNQFIGAGSR